MDRTFLLLGALAGFTGVGFGAFGAHGLSGRLSPQMLDVFEVGVRYQVYHALALLLVAALLPRFRSRLMTVAGWLFAAGIVVFSGSLYVLVLTNTPILGAVTPLGGLALLGGWACVALAAAQADA